MRTALQDLEKAGALPLTTQSPRALCVGVLAVHKGSGGGVAHRWRLCETADTKKKSPGAVNVCVKVPVVSSAPLAVYYGDAGTAVHAGRTWVGGGGAHRPSAGCH